MSEQAQGVEVNGSHGERFDEILTAGALDFVARLHRQFDSTRRELLAARMERQKELDAGGTLDFLSATREVREGDWTIAPEPDALQNRRVEITGPTSRKMVINALNSGACGFMADFEDSNSPTWRNMIGGQVNLADAVRGTIEHEENAKQYRLNDEVATLLVRPRGWHLEERHLLVDGEPVAGGVVDFGLYIFHNARELLERGGGPYFYLPKIESHREARLWNEVFNVAEDHIGLQRGTVKATVLIETLPAAFEMDEILFELREHSAGLNAGRWDYIFSAIKRFRTRPEFVTPDRTKITMTVPFMRAYTELLVKTCHRRGAHAIGGMAAQIPSRTDEQANEMAVAALREDKRREAGDGFDGTWVAHPDSVAAAMQEFDEVLADKPHQVDRRRDDVEVSVERLLDVPATPGDITEEGLRSNINVAIQYISSWLRGVGAAAIYGMMEDAATAEIARAQVWQWVRHRANLEDGRTITAELVRELETSELEKIRAEIDDDDWFETEGRPGLSREIFEEVALAEEFVEFLTLPAGERLEENAN
ncbi:MAG: Malate synthase [uncultured Solirubrobacteraceae bacterium]|uniref:Malate synthase n=1 Tax=uncultured Solirubrobacteraceae bacterium TaxID=1162706 RepID=A0A6J4S6C9_9ACTN|nr:MAG: Malate synthase [uncultured Solirubrobacteraceae bacterium]